MDLTTLPPKSFTVLCNWGDNPDPHGLDDLKHTLRLGYMPDGGCEPNVNIGLPNFIRGVYYIPPRILDLLELAAYVYCADRFVDRGPKQAVEYQSWSRSFRFLIRVRDYEFWSAPNVSQALSDALQFMTGDSEYQFEFYSGHSTPSADLFDREEFQIESEGNLSVMLFSGGLDSLAGALERLESDLNHVCLVSHQSQSGTKRTQNQLVEALKAHYPGRVSHYRFACNLRGTRAPEETQRTRAFLYTSIAFAIAQAFTQDCFSVYENGVTSINFARRADLINARASRTTHPKTIRRLQKFFSLVAESNVTIETPYLWKTKTDILRILRESPHRELIPSSVSCGRTFQPFERQTTHCGVCSQCVDRRIAAYAAKVDDLDNVGLYAVDIITEGLDPVSIEGREAKSTVVDYIRQARNFAISGPDYFQRELLSELSDVVYDLPGFEDEIEALEQVWELCHRHGEQVLMAMDRMRTIHENVYQTLPPNSLLQVIADREFLKNPVDLLVKSVASLVDPAIPNMFRDGLPANESDFNSKVYVFLQSHFSDLKREHPALSFACGEVRPDHSLDDLWIESKYIRKGTRPSRASEGMAADLTKYPSAHTLFLVYDPYRAIRNDDEFQEGFESKGKCTVCILR